MIISNNLANPYSKITFNSRSDYLKKTDNVFRKIMREFPMTYSQTKISKFSSVYKTKSLQHFQNYVDDLVNKYRKYYDIKDLNEAYRREILGLKKHQVGNCQEIADTTYMAFKLNGYKDVKIMWLFAYNPKKRFLRDLDHVVVGLNFRTPKDYKYVKSSTLITPKYCLLPQKDSILVDCWAGLCEYGKNIKALYDRKDLILGLTNNPKAKSILREGESLCFVPEGESIPEVDTMLPFFKKLFPQLLDSKKAKNLDFNLLKLELENTGFNPSEIDKLRSNHKLKGSPKNKSKIKIIKDFFVNIWSK